MTEGDIKVVVNWSSGKDAALAYHLLSRTGYEVTSLLTTLSEEHDRVFMHGVREKLLDMQAERMKLPLLKVKLPASPDDILYKAAMLKNLTFLKGQGVDVAAYGDIFLEDLKEYREKQLAQIGMTALFPLWKRDTRELVQMVETSGIEAIIVCVNEKSAGFENCVNCMNMGVLRADIAAALENHPYLSIRIIFNDEEMQGYYHPENFGLTVKTLDSMK